MGYLPTPICTLNVISKVTPLVSDEEIHASNWWLAVPTAEELNGAEGGEEGQSGLETTVF